MGDKINNVGAMLNNPKTRNLYLLGAGLAIITIVVGAFYATSSNNKPGSKIGSAQVSALPKADSVPGTSDSARYNKMVEEKNTKEADKAIAEGKTYIPTPVNKGAYETESPIDLMEKVKERKEQEAKELAEKQAREQAALNTAPIQPVAPVEPPQIQQVQQPAPVAMVAPKPSKKYGTDEDYLLITMLNGVSNVKAPKSEFDYAGQELKESSAAQQNVQSTQGTMAKSQAVQTKGELLAKAGTIIPAVLESNINSDEPSPVMAKIVSGELKGTRLIGKLNLTGEKVLVEFSTASIPALPHSIKVNSVAIDPSTSRTVLASDVDRHYFLRYGVLLGAAFLGGYADAIKSQNQTCTTNILGGQTCTTNSGLSSKQINQQAIGSMGKELANETRRSTANLKPTVTVNAGIAIGVLIMDDWYAPNN